MHKKGLRGGGDGGGWGVIILVAGLILSWQVKSFCGICDVCGVFLLINQILKEVSFFFF